MKKKKTQKKAAAADGDEQQPCRFRRNRCKNFSDDNHLQFCDTHYKFHLDFLRNNPSISIKNNHLLLESETPDLTKKKKKHAPNQQSSIIPPDEERCCRNDGVLWRCKNFRMSRNTDDDGPSSVLCEKHYNSNKKNLRVYLQKKRKKLNGGDDSDSDIETRDSISNCSKRRRKRQLKEEYDPPSTNYTNAETIVGGGSAKFWTKRKYEERTEELKSLTKTREPVVKTWTSKRRKMVTEGDRFVDETSNEPATNDNCDSDGIVEGGSPKIGTKSKNVVRAKGSGEPVIELESVELYKSKCFELFMEREKNKMELEKMKMELEKKKSECTELQDKLAEVEETRNSTPRDEDATKYWMNKCSDLESLVLRMENENSTMRRVVSNLESLVQRTGKESSILRCQELRNSEKIESEALGLQNEITQTGDKQRDKNNKSKPSAEISGGWGKDSRTYELKTKEKVLNVNDWAGLEERPSQHRSPSQAHPEMSKMTFVNLLSDSVDAGDSLSESEEIDCLIDSKISLSDPMDMLALKNLNMNNDEMKWKSEADMLSSFEKDTELCMKAICALYRQQISEDEISLKGLVIDEDMHRCIGFGQVSNG